MRIGNLEVYRIEGNSMFPAYKEGELILVLNSKNIHPPYESVVIVRRREGKSGKVFKRVIAIPNDIVRIESKKVFVNDKLTVQENFIGNPTHSDASQKAWKLEDNEYFVIGDNLSQSTDSRDFGPITFDEIISKVILKIWSKKISRYFRNIFR